MEKARNRVDLASRVISSKDVPDALKKFAKGKYFYIKTFGCQANIRDGEILAGFLSEAGFSKTEDPRQADVAIINTCAVRENAEEKVYGEIGTFKINKEKNPSFILAVCGCMMQEEGVASSLMKTYPFVSLVFGTHNTADILSMLNDVVISKKREVDVLSFPGEVCEGLPSLRLSPFEAFVNISYGCDKFCTYCIVPYTRGRERSRLAKDVIKECQDLVYQGYKEITLLGQNVNSYGLDLHDGTSFASLLEEVAKLGVPRLRFLTSYPSQFTDDVIDVMAKYDNIVKWLHLPVQSGSDSCLRRMGRRYSREQYLDLVKRIRAKMPSIALTTDIIVGFPNETEDEFNDTLSLAKEVGYSAAFTFIYSPRRGTPAASIKDNVTDKEKHERFNRLVEVTEDSTSKHSLSMVGQTFTVLVEGGSKKDASILSGYAENGKLINFAGPNYLTGCLVPVKVTESHTYSLLGELVEDPIISKAKDCAYLMSKDPLFNEYLRLDKALKKDNVVASLGDELVKSKKALSLSLNDPKSYEEKKKEYQDVLTKIKNNPTLQNEESLQDEVAEELMRVRDLIK
jgi:tRNA-2-methylthio-N6-dimethylallyladenosine synthase